MLAGFLVLAIGSEIEFDRSREAAYNLLRYLSNHISVGSMGNDKNWVDYANLGSNLYQNVQLGDLQQKLGAMAALAASEQAAAGMEDERREIVFKANKVLSEMRALAAENKAGVLALAKQTLANFKRSGISSGAFRAYDDKERVAALVGGYEALADECASALSPAERTDAQLCAEYLAEQGLLSQYLGLRQRQDESKQELKEAESQLRILQSKSVPRTAAIGAVLTFLGLGLLAIGGEDSKLTPFAGLLIMSGVITILVGVLIHGFSAKRKRAEAKRKEVEKLRLDLNWLNELSDPVLEWGEQLDSKSSSELKEMQARRDTIIRNVLKTAPESLAKPLKAVTNAESSRTD